MPHVLQPNVRARAYKPEPWLISTANNEVRHLFFKVSHHPGSHYLVLWGPCSSCHSHCFGCQLAYPEPVHPERAGAHGFAYNPTLPGPPKFVNPSSGCSPTGFLKSCWKSETWAAATFSGFSSLGSKKKLENWVFCFLPTVGGARLGRRGKSPIVKIPKKHNKSSN